MKTSKIFSVLAIGLMAVATLASCSKKEDPTSLQLSKTSATVEAGKTLAITAKVGSDDVTAKATWTSSDATVATVAAGVITGVKSGSAVITASYNGNSATCKVNVAGSGAVDTRLDGSQYVVFSMDETTYAKISSKVAADMRVNGEYVDGAIAPEDAHGAIQIWNPGDEIATNPNVGPNSFGLAESWFGVASSNPTPATGWGNICGGYFLRNNDGCFAGFGKITADHVYCVALKGKYTSTRTMEIGMKINGTEVWFLKVEKTTGADNDGDWEIFEVPVTKIMAFPLEATGDEAFGLMYRAAGAGAKVDVDAAFCYIPAAK